MEASFNKLDLTGKLIIKATLGQDIRRIPIHNDDLTYDELVLMMQRVFRGSLDPSEELLLKYKDEDGDLVTITDDSDLSFAVQYCRVLRLTISRPAGQQEGASLSPAVTEELRAIRDRVVHLLDLCSSSQPPCPPQEASLPQAEVEASAGLGQGLQPGSREFDPLGQEQQAAEGDTASQQGSETQPEQGQHTFAHINGAPTYPVAQEAAPAQYSAPPSPYPGAAPLQAPQPQYSGYPASAAPPPPPASPKHPGYAQGPPVQAPQPSFQAPYSQAPAPQASYSQDQAPQQAPPTPYSQSSQAPTGPPAPYSSGATQPTYSTAPALSYPGAPQYPPAPTSAPGFTPAQPRPTGPPVSYPAYRPPGPGGPAFPPTSYPGGPTNFPPAGPPSNPYSGGLPRPGAPQAYGYPQQQQQGPPGGYTQQ